MAYALTYALHTNAVPLLSDQKSMYSIFSEIFKSAQIRCLHMCGPTFSSVLERLWGTLHVITIDQTTGHELMGKTRLFPGFRAPEQ